MTEDLSFTADAAIINRLGRELVAKQETALIEIIKNCYDADSNKVKVTFDIGVGEGELKIVDDGIGMGRDEIINGFLKIASGLKIEHPVSGIYKRNKAGRKGIGRFSTQRLGRKLSLRTRREEDSIGWELLVNWDDFESGKTLQDIKVVLARYEKATVGTEVIILGLRDTWSDAQIKRAWRGVLSLQQPFPIAPVKNEPSIDPGFSVDFYKGGGLYENEMIIADLKSEILDHLHALIEMMVNDEGDVFWKISKNKLGESFDWRRYEYTSKDADGSNKEIGLTNVWMKAYHVVLEPSLLPSFVYTRVRDELSKRGGVALYRNGFRVVPYGDSDNDWLQLDEAYAKRSILASIANRNFFGAIQIDDVEGVYFEEHTSREGLVETPAFTRLKAIASSVLISAATRIAQERGRKTRTSKSDPNHGQFKDDDVKHSLTQLREIVETKISNDAINTSKDRIGDKKEVIEAIESAERNFKEYQQALADERSMLQFLATLGMTTAEFSHEAGMTFNAVRLDFKTIFEWMQRECKDADFLSLAEKTQLMLARLDTLTSYLNSLAGARASRNVLALSLSKAVEDFSHGIEMQASNQGVKLEVFVPDFDPLYSAPMHEAEVASILLNLYTNAVKAVKRKGKEKKIKVQAGRSDGYVFFVFSDSGDGIAEENRERIYDAFFTTRSAPHGGASEIEHLKGTGLGLWIVHQIISNISGKIELIDSSDGYSTSFKVSFLEERPDE